MDKLLAPISRTEARMKNPLVLAYIGDTIYDLYHRTTAVKRSQANVNILNKEVSGRVNARAQSHAAALIEDMLTEEEQGVFHRGRNAKSGTSPKNMDIVDYRRATGLEALIGFLYLSGDEERIEELMGVIIEEEQRG